MRLKPRYFERIEECNVKGAEFVGEEVLLKSLWLEEIEKSDKDLTLIDTRSKEAYFGGHIPGSIYFIRENISSYMGSVLHPDTPIAFIIDDNEEEKLKDLYWFSRRMGFEKIKGFVANGISQWESIGKDLETLQTITAEKYIEIANENEDYILLDVRKNNELEEEDPSKNRMNIPLQNLYKDWEEIPSNKTIYVLCRTGERSTIAASFIKSKGYDPQVISGGIQTLKTLLNK
nr:rhodanese-like domain-containing protein [Anaeromonas frigoriresistens]